MKRSGFPSDSHDENISIECMLPKRRQVRKAACGQLYTLKTAAFERCTTFPFLCYFPLFFEQQNVACTGEVVRTHTHEEYVVRLNASKENLLASE